MHLLAEFKDTWVVVWALDTNGLMKKKIIQLHFSNGLDHVLAWVYTNDIESSENRIYWVMQWVGKQLGLSKVLISRFWLS